MEILHTIDIKTTPEALYEAITTQKGLAGWWTPDVKAEARVGAINAFSFGGAFTMTFRVEALVPPRRIEWSAQDVPPDWKGTRITVDIAPRGNRVHFEFSHSGLPTGYEEFGFFNYCWGQYVRSLKLYLETGAGEPYGSPAANAWHPLSA